MSSILKRLVNIARSHIGGAVSKGFSSAETGFRFQKDASSKVPGEKRHRGDTGPKWPRQVVDDLAVFELKPPSSLEEVRKVRNREVKKYHSDRFAGDSEREETSKRIMQIYNAAFDRLEKWYQDTPPSQTGK
ncbi:MAG TPA: hypothetical protein DCZ69_01995 [Syntrophobacteraceae bacterium]|nr:hypothetical protein [Syntrophobacteraceae bacterium]HBZ54702.1 hypothetical protein [Syntrophobacteraceae bacterium]